MVSVALCTEGFECKRCYQHSDVPGCQFWLHFLRTGDCELTAMGLPKLSQDRGEVGPLSTEPSQCALQKQSSW
jgi:hypothetical protein